MNGIYPLVMLTVNNNNGSKFKCCPQTVAWQCLSQIAFRFDNFDNDTAPSTQRRVHSSTTQDTFLNNTGHIPQQHRTHPWFVGLCKNLKNVKQTRNTPSKILINPANQAGFTNQPQRNDHEIGALHHSESPHSG